VNVLGVFVLLLILKVLLDLSVGEDAATGFGKGRFTGCVADIARTHVCIGLVYYPSLDL